MATITGSLHPVLAITKFSLNGVSMMRAYETRKHRVARLDVVCNSDSWFDLTVMADAVVLVARVAPRLKDQFFQVMLSITVQRKFLHIRVAMKTEQRSAVRQVEGQERRARRACGHAIHEARDRRE